MSDVEVQGVQARASARPRALTATELDEHMPLVVDDLPSKDERRVHERVELEADISLYSESNFWSGYTEDVSEGGLFVATWDQHAIGTRLELRFELPTGRVFRVRGEVRWLRDANESGVKPGVGIRFDALSDDDLAAIRAFVKHRSPMFWDDEP